MVTVDGDRSLPTPSEQRLAALAFRVARTAFKRAHWHRMRSATAVDFTPKGGHREQFPVATLLPSLLVKIRGLAPADHAQFDGLGDGIGFGLGQLSIAYRGVQP